MDHRYRPTTKEVRTAWFQLTQNVESFDRWLAEVKAEAFDTGFSTARFTDGEVDNPFRGNKLAKAIQMAKKGMTL